MNHANSKLVASEEAEPAKGGTKQAPLAKVIRIAPAVMQSRREAEDELFIVATTARGVRATGWRKKSW